MRQIALCFLIIMMFSGCKKENISGNGEFCSAISIQDHDKTLSVINKYLATQNKNLSDEQKIDKLKKWLAAKSCILEVNIFCISCIYTLPAQSELRIRFMIDGRSAEQTLDISMSNPLKAVGFHE